MEIWVYNYHIERAYYWIKAGDTTYVLVNSWNVGFHSPKAPLNLTINGKVKIAVEGQDAYVVDDSGKEIKRRIVAKIADDTPPEATEQESEPREAEQESRPDASTSDEYQVLDTHSSSALGVVYVSSNPSEAVIYADDSFVSKAPATLNLKPGQHYVRAFLRGYKNWSRQITTTAGSEARLTITLEKSN